MYSDGSDPCRFSTCFYPKSMYSRDAVVVVWTVCLFRKVGTIN